VRGIDTVRTVEEDVTRARHEHVDVAELRGRGGEVLHRCRIGDVEPGGEGLAPAGADLGCDLLAQLDPPGAQHDGVACGRQRLCGGRADARRRAAHRCHPPIGMGRELRTHRVTTVVGRWARPRTLTLCTRRTPSGSTSYSLTRATSSLRTRRDSRRASDAPRQKWRATPKLTSADVSRSRSYRSACGNTASSRLAEPMRSSTRDRAGIVPPSTSTSVVAKRASAWLDVSYRSVSSIHASMRLGSANGLAGWSGLRHAQYHAFPSSLVVVSLPATTMRKRNATISSSSSRSPSTSACVRADTRSSRGVARRS